MQKKASPGMFPKLENLSDKLMGEHAGLLLRPENQAIMVELVAYAAMMKANGQKFSEYTMLSFVFSLGWVQGHESAQDRS